MATYNTAFGSLPSTQDMTGQNNTTAGGAQQQRPRRTSTAQTGSGTFADMQKAGQARPAPPPDGGVAAAGQATASPFLSQVSQTLAPAAAPAAAPAQAAPSMGVSSTGASYERFGGSGLANTMMSQLQQQLQQMQGAPSRFEDPAYKAARDAALANMEASAGAERSKLEEEMASRGLAASTISGGRYGDLAGQQARARATMEADLLKEQAATSAQDRQTLLSSMGDLAKTAGAQSLGEFNANIESMKASGQLDMAAKELMQKAQLEGRSMDLQSARDQVAAELGRGDLSFKYSSLAQEKGIEEGRLAETRALRLQNLGISNQELELKTAELMGADKTGRLTRQAAQDQAELAIKTKQLMQTDRSLSITEAQNLAQNEIDLARNKISEGQLAETTRANKAQETQAGLDYKLRELLGTDAAALDKKRVEVGENEFKLSLVKVIADGGLSPDEADALYRKFGYEPPPRPVPTSTSRTSTSSRSSTGTPPNDTDRFTEE